MAVFNIWLSHLGTRKSSTQNTMRTLPILLTLIVSTTAQLYANSWMHFDQFNTPIPSNSITSILHSGAYTWVGTDQGLARFDGTEWEVFTEETSVLPSNHIQQLHKDNYGNVWVATYNGLVHITCQGWEVMNMSNSPIQSDQIKCIANDAAGNYWFGTWGHGLILFDGAHWEQYRTENSDIPSNGIFKVSVDNEERIWIGTFNSGVAYYNGERWETMTTNNSQLPNNNVREVLFENGNTWLGTDDGLAMIDSEGNWNVHTYAELGHSIHAIHQGVHTSGQTYFATDGGLLRFQNGQFTVYTAQNSDISSNSLRCISPSEDGNLWLGSANNGIDIYSPAGTLSASEQALGHDFSVYPNPAADQLQIEFGREHSGPIELLVHNAAGQLLIQETLPKNTQRTHPISLAKFPAGYFTVSILSDSGFTSKKVLKL